MFSAKMAEMGSVNSVFMRFPNTIFHGMVSDFQLQSPGGGIAPHPKALGGRDSPLCYCRDSEMPIKKFSEYRIV